MKKFMYFVAVLMLTTIVFSCKKDDKGNDNPPDPPIVTEDYYLYGFSTDKSKSATNIGNSQPGELDFEAATEFAGSDIAAKATKIAGVRMSLGEGAISGKVFITNELGGTNVVEKEFTVENPGWQYILFDTPVEVSADLTYYVGYECKGEGYFLGCDKVNGKSNYTYINDEGVWQNFTAIGLNNYTLSLQAICQGGDYSGESQHELTVFDNNFPENIRANQHVDFKVTVISLGVKTTGKVTVKCTCGPDELTQTVNNLRNGESKTVDFSLEAASASMQNVVVEVTEDGVGKTATATKAVSVFAEDAPERNCILIEEFTSQSCPNCPDGIETLRKAIAGMDIPKKAAWIAHHSGYNPDNFTLQGDLTIASKFGANFAPSCMIDRQKVDYGEGPELLWHPGYSTSKLLNNLTVIPADAEMDMTVSLANFNTDSTFTVTVTGNCAKTAYITIVLCQNGIVANQSSGGSNFVHNEIVRAYLTEATGDVLNRDDDGNFTFNVTYTLPATISNYQNKHPYPTDLQNMYVVAFIHGDCSSKGAVYNADQVLFSDIMNK